MAEMGRKRQKTKRNGIASALAKDLPCEIVSDILSRLPVKSLVRFRCVSKSWCSTMSDRSFVDSHLMHSRDRPDGRTLLVSLYTSSHFEVSFFTKDHQHGTLNPVHFLNQHNPLVSIVSESLNGIIFIANNDTIHACNLSTREAITLPPYNQAKISPYTKSFSFGFDPATNQYKILKSLIQWTRKHGRVINHKVLTVGTKSWRPIKCSIPIKNPRPESVCINGAVHFRNSTARLVGLNEMAFDEEVIMVFDVGAEEFRTISIPEPASLPRTGYTLMKLKDCLALVDLELCGTMNVWILEDYQNQVWRQYRIQLPSYWNDVSGVCVNGRLSSVDTGEIVIIPLVTPRLDESPMYLFYYDMESNIVRKVEYPGSPDNVLLASGTHFLNTIRTDCVESILSVREFCV